MERHYVSRYLETDVFKASFFRIKKLNFWHCGWTPSMAAIKKKWENLGPNLFKLEFRNTEQIYHTLTTRSLLYAYYEELKTREKYDYKSSLTNSVQTERLNFSENSTTVSLVSQVTRDNFNTKWWSWEE